MHIDDELSAFGPFFTVSTHTAAPRRPWRSLGDVINDTSTLRARTEQVRAALATSASAPVEARVAASVTHFGLAARLVAPVLGLAVLGDPNLAIDARDV